MTSLGPESSRLEPCCSACRNSDISSVVAVVDRCFSRGDAGGVHDQDLVPGHQRHLDGGEEEQDDERDHQGDFGRGLALVVPPVVLHGATVTGS